MIDRYTLPEMGAVWTEENRYRKWLDVEISPLRTTWYTAVQFRNDPAKKWVPRVTCFYPSAQMVAVRTTIDDAEPTWVSAETIITMADIRAQSPQPPKTAS